MPSEDAVLKACRSAADDREHGAGEIEERLIRDLLTARSSWTRESLAAGARLLVSGQPMMANLRSLAKRVGTAGGTELAAALERRRAVLETLPQRLADGAWPRVADSATVVTLSRSSAVAAVIEGARARGWHGTVVVLDGSDGGGGPAQAERLAAGGVALSQPDATAHRWLTEASVTVVVGADAVGGDRFVNCVGTAGLLTVAAALGVPRVLVADTGKDLPAADLDDLLRHLPLHRDNRGREWPLFEAVPMALVTARISESS
jgi:translation initiation factor 2B subunit (eIF-2B alpha/beta/delta family)